MQELALSTWGSRKVGARPVTLVPMPSSRPDSKSRERLRETDIIVLRTHSLIDHQHRPLQDSRLHLAGWKTKAGGLNPSSV